MAKLDLTKATEQVHFGKDSIVVPKFIAGIYGGKTLDVSEWNETTINAGHIIITDGKGNYKPMPVSGDSYSELPGSWSYAGVLYRTILKKVPAASIMTAGELNEVAMPYKMESIKAAFSAAVPHVMFIKDEEA